jgi:hypothetical protein
MQLGGNNLTNPTTFPWGEKNIISFQPTSRVKTPGGYTDTFDSEMGVLQGCVLSRLLIGLFLDPLENSKLLLASDSKPPKGLGPTSPGTIFCRRLTAALHYTKRPPNSD